MSDVAEGMAELTGAGAGVEERDGILAGPVRRPRNAAREAKGSIHDDATATKLGFKGGTVAGSTFFDLFPPLALHAFGPRWFERGSASLYFRNAITDGEPVQAFLRRPDADGAAQVEAWVERREDDLRCAEGTLAVGDPGVPSALRERLAAAAPAGAGAGTGELRMMAGLEPGASLGTFTTRVTSERQEQRRALITDPLDWYWGDSPWSGPIATLAAMVPALYSQPADAWRPNVGGAVGLFGAIELRFIDGPMLVDVEHTLTSRVAAVGQTPKSEYLWFETAAEDPDGRRVAELLMMLRFMKASSSLYAD